MTIMIPSRHKLAIFNEPMAARISDWQPSDEMIAAMVCRLYGWPLWTPISAERIADFRARVLTVAVHRWRQKRAGQVPGMPHGLTRPEQHAVLRMGSLIERRERPSRWLTARLIADDFWTSAEWDTMQRGVIPHYGIFVGSPHLMIGRTVAYAARKIGLPPPPFSEGSRVASLHPLHVIAINAGGPDEAKAWHRRLAEIYDHRLPANPVAAQIPEQVLVLRDALAELETVARRVLELAVDSPAMLEKVCLGSSDWPLGILSTLAAAPVQESGLEKVAVKAAIEEPEVELEDEPVEGPWSAPELRPPEDREDYY